MQTPRSQFAWRASRPQAMLRLVVLRQEVRLKNSTHSPLAECRLLTTTPWVSEPPSSRRLADASFQEVFLNLCPRLDGCECPVVT